MLCNSTEDLNEKINKYGLDRNHPVIKVIYSDFHRIEMATFGYDTVPLRRNTQDTVSLQAEISLENRFSPLDNITLEEWDDFREIYDLSSQELSDFVMKSDLVEVSYIL